LRGATWRLLVDAGWMGDERLRLLVGGEALSPELAVKLLARGSELWKGMGIGISQRRPVDVILQRPPL